jgi:hypothetical protein
MPHVGPTLPRSHSTQRVQSGKDSIHLLFTRMASSNAAPRLCISDKVPSPALLQRGTTNALSVPLPMRLTCYLLTQNFVSRILKVLSQFTPPRNKFC